MTYAVARVAAVLATAVLVAGCATTSTNTLAQAKRDALRIDAVELAFASNSDITWPDLQSEAAGAGQPESPAARQAFLQQKASGPIKAALAAEIPPAFRGTEPARLRVIVRRVMVPSVVQRILIGGTHEMTASIQLTDARTGQTLLDVPEFNGTSAGGGGLLQVAVEQMFPDPIDRVSRAFASALKVWLKGGQAFASGEPGAAMR
jgi:hypothetical protein